jgi:hypothetical protein
MRGWRFWKRPSGNGNVSISVEPRSGWTRVSDGMDREAKEQMDPATKTEAPRFSTRAAAGSRCHARSSGSGCADHATGLSRIQPGSHRQGARRASIDRWVLAGKRQAGSLSRLFERALCVALRVEQIHPRILTAPLCGGGLLMNGRRQGITR